MELGKEVVNFKHYCTTYENVPHNLRCLISWRIINSFASIVTFRDVLTIDLSRSFVTNNKKEIK